MDEYILKKDFLQLKNFIEACLGKSSSIDENDKKHLTVDRQTLMEMTERLSLLLDQPVAGMKLPEFQPWSFPDTNNQLLLKKFYTFEDRRLEEYRRDAKEYKSLLAEIRGEFGSGRKVITDIFAAIEKRFKDTIDRQVIKIPWTLLPGTSEERFSEIVNHFKSLEDQTSSLRYDIDRLHKVYSLNADEIYIGIEEFKGYVVFYITGIETAILECPIQGNAIYVFQKNWFKLSKLSKSALMSGQKDNILRIIHNGNWFSRLEWLINNRKNRKTEVESVHDTRQK